MIKLLNATLCIIIAFVLNACMQAAPSNLTVCRGKCRVQWSPNREKAVNSSGGGYRVYYCKRQSFKITESDVSMKEVPYVTGPLAPIFADIDPGKDTCYIKVTAYSSLNGGSESAPSN
ncbi:MAG: hypothetical protein MUD12_15925 [Spirochaetes bacterium]|jgi:hypothetical protein|nr:hypothetical protein [Spirochaetota bacterium]